MTPKPLSTYFSLNRRYYRSVNLVRDLDKPDAVQGYVPTEAAAGALRRILPAFTHLSAHRAWTITGVYGTGKSAFAHYLTALCADDQAAVKQEALQKEGAAKGSGFIAKRLTLTEPDGREINQVIWMDAQQAEYLDKLATKALEMLELQDSPHLQQAFVVKLSERVLSQSQPDSELADCRQKSGKTRSLKAVSPI